MNGRTRLPPLRLLHAALAAALLVALAGCQTLREIAALREVDFAIDRASRASLAGVSLDRVRSAGDLGSRDLLRLADAVRRRDLPLSFTLHVAAENPADNDVTARLLALDWRLLLRGRETIAGRLDRATSLPAGRIVDVPLHIELDLWRFFQDDLDTLVDVAVGAAGGGRVEGVELLARPTVDTPLGPIRYPGEIRITAR